MPRKTSMSTTPAANTNADSEAKKVGGEKRLSPSQSLQAVLMTTMGISEDSSHQMWDQACNDLGN